VIDRPIAVTAASPPGAGGRLAVGRPGPSPVRASGLRARVGFALLGLALLVGAGIAQAASAIPPGAPIERRYTAADYSISPNHYGVIAARDGAIYVASFEGLLRYSSGRFDVFPLPNRAQVQSVAEGADGRIYYSGYDVFGYLEEQPNGEARFHDLSPKYPLPADEGGIGVVWSAARLGEHVYFQSDRRIFEWGTDGSHRSFRSPATMHKLFVVAGALYVRVDGIGITRIDGDRFLPIPGAEMFADEGAAYVEGQPDGGLLILSRDRGFYLADASGMRALPSPSDSLLKAVDVYTALRLPDGTLAVASRGGELLVLDRARALVRHYRASSYPITDFALDDEGGVWVATEGELVRMVLPSPWSVFTAQDGLEGSLTDTVWWNHRRWVGSSVGIQRSEQDDQGQIRFQRLPWTRSEVWDLEPTRTGLLWAGRESLNLVVGEQNRVVSEAPFPALVVVSPLDPDRAYVPYDPGFMVVAQGSDGWREVARMEPEGLSTYGIVETTSGHLWIGNVRGAAHEVQLSADGARIERDRALGAEDGLPAAPRVSVPFQLDDRLYLVVDQRIYAWNGRRFEESDAEGLGALISRPEELVVHRLPDGTTYANTSRELLVRKPGERKWQSLRIDTPLARGYTQLSAESDGSVSLVGWNALLRYDPSVIAEPPPPMRTRLYRVRAHLADGSVQLMPRSGAETVQLPPHNSVEFEFGANSAEGGIEYRVQLVGLDHRFGEWSSLARREFAALPPGAYRLNVETRAPSGRATENLGWAFEVQPRWYQTGLARLGAVLIALALAALAARHYAQRRLRLMLERNRELEVQVGERTADLARANRQLARLATLDGLTGIANRRAFDNFIEHAWQEAGRAGEPLSLLMMDVDHFKHYNDAHGHLAGDDLLKRIAGELARAAQGEAEQLSRYGGEEFALVLRGIDGAVARSRAETICIRFRQQLTECPTISIGVATRRPSQGGSVRELIDAADHALYQAKHNGRARVESEAA